MDNGSQRSPSAGEGGSQSLLFCSLPKSNRNITWAYKEHQSLTEVETNKGCEGQKEGHQDVCQLSKGSPRKKSCPAAKRGDDLVAKDIMQRYSVPFLPQFLIARS